MLKGLKTMDVNKALEYQKKAEVSKLWEDLADNLDAMETDFIEALGELKTLSPIEARNEAIKLLTVYRDSILIRRMVDPMDDATTQIIALLDNILYQLGSVR